MNSPRRDSLHVACGNPFAVALRPPIFCKGTKFLKGYGRNEVKKYKFGAFLRLIL